MFLTCKKVVLSAALLAIFAASCEKDHSTEVDSLPLDGEVSVVPTSKEVYGMLVVDSSIIFNSETLSLLQQADETELTFQNKPAQADSMAAGFILVTSSVTEATPNGLLVRSLGVSEDADGFKVKVEPIELDEYVLLADLKGTVSFGDQAGTPVGYTLPAETKNINGLTMPSASQMASVPRSNLKMIGGTLNGSAVDLTFPFTIAGGSSAVLDVAVQPSITYDISINAWRRQFSVSFGGNLALNNLGLTLTARVPLEVNFNGDEVFVPIPIPLGPILITPYFSVTPYLQAGFAGEGSVAVTSAGNIGFNFMQNGITPQGSADLNYDIASPEFSLFADGTFATGIQGTLGIGLYGKTVYAQVQAKIGPEFKMTNDILGKQTTLSARVPATVDASAGASILFFNLGNTSYRLYDADAYSREWVYNWPI